MLGASSGNQEFYEKILHIDLHHFSSNKFFNGDFQFHFFSVSVLANIFLSFR